MVLREGKGVEAGSRIQQLLSLPGQTASFSPFPFLPLKTKTNASIPRFWALGQSIHSLWGRRKHHHSLTPTPPWAPSPSRLPGMASG